MVFLHVLRPASLIWAVSVLVKKLTVLALYLYPDYMINYRDSALALGWCPTLVKSQETS